MAKKLVKDVPKMVSVNMSNVKSNFELLENDDYMAFFAKREVRTAGPDAKNPGAKYFSLEFTLDKEANPAVGNRKMWGTLGGTPNSLWAVKEFLIKMGYPQEELDKEDADASEAEDLDPDDLIKAIDVMLSKVIMGRVILRVVTEDYMKKNKITKEMEPAKRNTIAEYVSIFDAA